MATKTLSRTFATILVIAMICIFAFFSFNNLAEPKFLKLNSETEHSYKLSENFACISFGGIDIYSLEGELVFSEKMQFDLEKTASDGEKVAIVSNDKVRVYGSDGFDFEISGEGEIVSLVMNENVLIIVRDDYYYSYAVEVFDGENEMFTRYIARAEEVSAVFSDENIFIFCENNENSYITVLDISGEELYTQVLNERISCKLYALNDGIAAVSDGKIVFYHADGEETGEFVGSFSSIQKFGDLLYIMTENKVLALSLNGKVLGETNNLGKMPRKFGTGDYPTVIFGENATVFTSLLEVKYTIENEFVPNNIITYRNDDVLVWKNAVVIHRK